MYSGTLFGKVMSISKVKEIGKWDFKSGQAE